MIKIIVISCMVFTLSVAGNAQGKSLRGDQDAAYEAQKSGAILPFQKIKQRVQPKVNGKIIGERLRRTNEGWVYELRVRQKKGKIAFFVVDAQNGRILSKRTSKKHGKKRRQTSERLNGKFLKKVTI